MNHEHEPIPASGAPETTGVFLPPPAIYAGALLAGFGLEALLPSSDLPGLIVWPIGAVLLACGVLLVASFLRALRRAGTTVDPRGPTTRLVTTGPYRFTRNPGYLGLAAISVGVATLAAAFWAYLTLAVALVLVDRMVIAREERYLERRFGEDYERYRARTRRWL